jgi:hypothetical protein
MRVANRSVALLIAIPFLLWALRAFSATPVQDECDWDKVQKVEATSLSHPQLFFEAQKPLMESNRWLEVLRAIKEDFTRSTAFTHDDNYARFLRQIEAMEREFEEVTSSPDFERLTQSAQKVMLARFRIVRDPDADKVYLFFRQPDQVTIDAAMSPDVRRQYCWRALSINRILTQYGEKARAATALALQTYVAQWDSYNANGYLQYPWELYLNGKWAYDRDSLAPPRRQWVIAHPNVAIEQAGPNLKSSRLDQIVTLEPIGYLWYTEDRKSYLGLAALLTFSSDRDVGRGLLLHFGKTAKLGYVWRDKDAQNHSQNGVVFTMDLYQLLADPPQSQFDSRGRTKAILDKVLNSP